MSKLGNQPRVKWWLRRRQNFVRKLQTNDGICLDIGSGLYPLYEKSFHIDKYPFLHVECVLDVDNEPLPCNNETVDKIFCLEVVEHLKNPEFFLKEALRVLKHDGLLIISYPNERNLIWKMVWFVWSHLVHQDKDHVGKFTLEMLQDFLITKFARVNWFLYYVEAKK